MSFVRQDAVHLEMLVESPMTECGIETLDSGQWQAIFHRVASKPELLLPPDVLEPKANTPHDLSATETWKNTKYWTNMSDRAADCCCNASCFHQVSCLWIHREKRPVAWHWPLPEWPVPLP